MTLFGVRIATGKDATLRNLMAIGGEKMAVIITMEIPWPSFDRIIGLFVSVSLTEFNTKISQVQREDHAQWLLSEVISVIHHDNDSQRCNIPPLFFESSEQPGDSTIMMQN